MTDIYQTLEDKGNYEEIKRHGSYFCSTREMDGSLKKGSKEPWLGGGYYFWDTRINDAHWWGRTVYWQCLKGYIVCHTVYDQYSPLLFDLVGNMSHIDRFEKCALDVKRKTQKKRVSVPYVLEILKQHTDFAYKAVRAWPAPKTGLVNPQIDMFFPGNKTAMIILEKVQICFFDKTLLCHPFNIKEIKPFPKNFTI